ncbi:MAG TPA: FAD-dependent oxidoreductase, partial [Chitinophagaceae bacterium]|nr:FAD-dependent oxidoreductase [Chitinophagaceae bacterium]
MGEDAMLHIVEQRIKGIEKVRKHFTDQEIDFDACGGYECFTKTDTTLVD